jgi:hypothetical protein
MVKLGLYLTDTDQHQNRLKTVVYKPPEKKKFSKSVRSFGTETYGGCRDTSSLQNAILFTTLSRLKTQFMETEIEQLVILAQSSSADYNHFLFTEDTW